MKNKKVSLKEIEKIKTLYKQGKTVPEISKIVGLADNTVRRKLAQNGLYEKKKLNYIAKPSICWNCVNAAKGNMSECQWAKKYEPRDDWNAIKTELRQHSNKLTESYLVLSCPGFEKG